MVYTSAVARNCKRWTVRETGQSTATPERAQWTQRLRQGMAETTTEARPRQPTRAAAELATDRASGERAPAGGG